MECWLFVCIVLGNSGVCPLLPARGVFAVCFTLSGRCPYHNIELYSYTTAVNPASYGLLNREINRGKNMDAYLPPPLIFLSK